MRKKLVFFYAIFGTILTILSIYILVIFEKKEETYDNTNIYAEEEKKIFEIKEYLSHLPTETIQVKITSTGEIIELTMDDYLYRVLPAEMPPYYDIEALKAQAIVARTYAYEKMLRGAHGDCDICDNSAHCQAYITHEQLMPIWERRGYSQELREEYYAKIKEAVNSTSNICITYSGELIKAYFHACSGGKTENVSEIWGRQNIPYLTSVESIGEESHPSYTSTAIFSFSELEQQLNSNSTKTCNMTYLYDNMRVKILDYTSSGRVNNIAIGGSIYTAQELRNALGLKSTNFTVEESPQEVKFNVLGYGHGIGMSQIGADAMAKKGATFNEIICHYYTGVNLSYIVTNNNI